MELEGVAEEVLAELGDIVKFSELAAQFVEDVTTHCSEMKASLAELVENPLNDEARSLVNEISHIIQGQGGTFGYHLISNIATAANDLLREKDTLEPKDVRNLSNHVEAISLIITKSMSGYGGKAGRILLQGLKDYS